MSARTLLARSAAAVGVGLACVALAASGAAGAATGPGAPPGIPQGNVTPTTTPATGVAAVAQSAPVDGRVAILVHNGSAKPVRIDLVSVVALGAGGGTAVRARGVAAYPQVLAPDQLALTSVRFRPRALAGVPNPQLTIKVRSTPVTSARALQALSVSGLTLSPPQSGAVAQTMQATLSNRTTSWTAHAPEAAVMCFGEAGNPTTFASARAAARRVRAGRSVSATVPLTSLCPAYLVAARAS